MGKQSREKGARFERSIANQWRQAMPKATIRRGFQARGGHEVADLDVPHFWPELKCGAKPNIRAALAQAVRGSADDDRAPIAIVRDDGSEPTATMRWSDFLRLASRLWEHGACVPGKEQHLDRGQNDDDIQITSVSAMGGQE